METNTKNMFETMANMQKQAVENLTNATEQMQKNLFNTNMVDSDIFKKWYDSQMAFFNQHKGDNNIGSNPMEFFNTWMNNQMESAKTWFSSNNNNNTFMNNMSMNEDMKKNYENMLNMFSNWSGSMNTTYNEMLKNFNTGSGKDAFSGMFNNAEMYLKSFELWMPMFKSIQYKTFTLETFKQSFNTPAFKDMMDKMFNMQPDFMKNMTEEAKANMFKMMDSNKGMFDNMKNMLNSNMPNNNEMFSQILANYNKLNNSIKNGVAPFMKLIPQGEAKQKFEMMNDIIDEFNVFNLKNNQMQYMMYATGLKAMEEVAESISNKIRNGEEVSDFTNIYNEWLSINDKNFVALFETDEYSKMQAEVSSFGMKLKRNINLQIEKSMENLPLINRTEMDELYKTIYELKKRINILEKQIDSNITETASLVKPTAKKASKA